jgi:hypothetical protein
MARLQDLAIEEINEAIADAVERNVPLTVTIKDGSQWITLHSRFVENRDGRVLIEPPQVDDDVPPREFAPADRLGVSFKLKHYKHITNVTVAGVEQLPLEGGQAMPVLSVVSPSKMQRAQRRAYLRAEVPDNRVVRASFWLGGCDAEPAGGDLDNPVWAGQVRNISAGGVQVEADPEAVRMIEIGEMVGMHISFGPGQESVRVDAQFRHLEKVGQDFLLGFQFLGLEATEEGKKTLVSISNKVTEIRNDAYRMEKSRRAMSS